MKKLCVGAAFLVASLCLCLALLRKGTVEPLRSANDGQVVRVSVAEPKAPVNGNSGAVFSIELKPSFVD